MTDKPHMTLPNGDIIREGDYAVTREGKKVGPMVFGHDGPYATTHPWLDKSDMMTFTCIGSWDAKSEPCSDDLIAKWHPVEPGPDPVAPPAKRRKWWIVGGKAFDSAREAKTAFPGSTPIKVKECKQ